MTHWREAASRSPTVLDALQEGGQVLVGVVEEVLQGLHVVRPGEAGASVAVEELGDRPGRCR